MYMTLVVHTFMTLSSNLEHSSSTSNDKPGWMSKHLFLSKDTSQTRYLEVSQQNTTHILCSARCILMFMNRYKFFEHVFSICIRNSNSTYTVFIVLGFHIQNYTNETLLISFQCLFIAEFYLLKRKWQAHEFPM